MRARRGVAALLIVVAVLVAAVAVEGITTIHLSRSDDQRTVHAWPGQIVSVTLDTTADVRSGDPAVVTPLGRTGGTPGTYNFVAVVPGKAQIYYSSGLRCLAMVCGWRVEVDVG